MYIKCETFSNILDEIETVVHFCFSLFCSCNQMFYYKTHDYRAQNWVRLNQIKM